MFKRNQLASPHIQEQQEQQPVKIKLLPQRLTYADICDICEDYPPATKIKKIQPNSKASAISHTERKLPKPVRMTINPADWDEPLPKAKSKFATEKDSVRRTRMLAKRTSNKANKDGVSLSTFAKSKVKSKKVVKTVRKELFSGSHSNVNRRYSRQTFAKKMDLDSVKKPQLDNTPPLIDINDVEVQLFRKPSCKQQFANNILLKRKFMFTKPSQTESVPKLEVAVPGNSTKVKRKSPKSLTPLNVMRRLNNSPVTNSTTDHCSHTSELPNMSCFTVSDHITVIQNNINPSNLSPTEMEFLELEDRLECASPQDLDLSANTTGKYKIVYKNQGTVNRETHAIPGQELLKNLTQKFKNLHQKFADLQHHFNEVEKEFNAFEGEVKAYDVTMNKMTENLENTKKFTSDKEWHVSSVKEAESSLPILPFSRNVPAVEKNTKIVSFNCDSSCKVETPDNFPLVDKSFKKSVKMYNSMREGYRALLTTPKPDRTYLQTPKSFRKKQADSVSRKVQKQCLLLLDTPSNKS